MENKLDDCICDVCHSSWPSAAAKNRHSKAHDRSSTYQDNKDIQENLEISDEIECDDIQDEDCDLSQEEQAMPIFSNMKEYLESPFEQLHDEFLD